MKTIIKLSKKLSDGYANIPIRNISKLKDLNFNLRYYLLCLFDLTSTEKFKYELTALKLSRYCGDNGNNPARYTKYIKEIKKLGYIYEDSDGNTTINIERIESQCIKYVNENDIIIKEKKRIKNNKQKNRENIKNLQQCNLSQESNINTSIENKTSQIEEKQSLNENKDITLKQEEKVQDITLNIQTEEINIENSSTDIENLQQEELSQESNTNTLIENKTSKIEEKQLIIKERFQDYVNEFIESDEYDKISTQFNKLLLDIKYDYSTIMLKKTYNKIKNDDAILNDKLNRLTQLIDIIIKHFKLEDYFNDNNFVENSIDYILNANYVTPVTSTKNNQITYTETETIETINEEESKSIYDEIKIPKNINLEINFDILENQNEELKQFHTINENVTDYTKKLYRYITTESLFNFYFTMNLIKKHNELIDDDYLFNVINTNKICLIGDRIDLYYYIINILNLNQTNEEIMLIYKNQFNIFKNKK